MLPPGYDLAYPNHIALSEIFPFNSKFNKNVHLCQSQSWLKMVISIAQLVYSSITLYETRGDQLLRYGYATFGLSVFPYTFMSLANFIVVGLIGEYPRLYMLRTAIMNECERRGGSFVGAIGNCAEDDSVHRPYAYGVDHDVSYNGYRWSSFTCATVSLEGSGENSTEVSGEWKEDDGLSTEDGTGLLPKILVVTVKGVTRKFKYQPGFGKVDYAFKLSSYTNQDHIPSGGYVAYPSQSLLPALFSLLYVVTLASLLLPYMVIFTLSKFKAGGSTLAQRAWMMSWIASGQLALLIFAAQYIQNPHLRLATFSIQLHRPTSYFTGNKLLLCLLIFAIPAVGGFITVGKMLAEFGLGRVDISVDSWDSAIIIDGHSHAQA
ncbi:hypothetical protein JAAARDRAFT_199128 [Jaapia argillacea MUCL 33604]|uniref:Uncharacterized protein n=1 Tax=Jaapia argillacea MUCL 33604 TaxID=933084 RepID=A0A067PCE5_9AGAM|nr:hypothetical protein JAAARDRAFT_199128 [Jaapia argillacea MUCL 33604]